MKSGHINLSVNTHIFLNSLYFLIIQELTVYFLFFQKKCINSLQNNSTPAEYLYVSIPNRRHSRVSPGKTMKATKRSIFCQKIQNPAQRHCIGDHRKVYNSLQFTSRCTLSSIRVSIVVDFPKKFVLSPIAFSFSLYIATNCIQSNHPTVHSVVYFRSIKIFESSMNISLVLRVVHSLLFQLCLIFFLIYMNQ